VNLSPATKTRITLQKTQFKFEVSTDHLWDNQDEIGLRQDYQFMLRTKKSRWVYCRLNISNFRQAGRCLWQSDVANNHQTKGFRCMGFEEKSQKMRSQRSQKRVRRWQLAVMLAATLWLPQRRLRSTTKHQYWQGMPKYC